MGKILVLDNLNQLSEPLQQFLGETLDLELVSSVTFLRRVHQSIPSLVLLFSDQPSELLATIGSLKASADTRRTGVICLLPNLSSFDEKSLYDSGADLVLTPPLDFLKLQNIIIALIRRVEGKYELDSTRCVLGAFELQSEIHALKVQGKDYVLTPTQTRLLSLFLKSPNELLTREFIRSRIWPRIKISNRSIDAQISKLRKVSPELHNCLEAIYGEGYTFFPNRLSKSQAS